MMPLMDPVKYIVFHSKVAHYWPAVQRCCTGQKSEPPKAERHTLYTIEAFGPLRRCGTISIFCSIIDMVLTSRESLAEEGLTRM